MDLVAIISPHEWRIEQKGDRKFPRQFTFNALQFRVSTQFCPPPDLSQLSLHAAAETLDADDGHGRRPCAVRRVAVVLFQRRRRGTVVTAVLQKTSSTVRAA
ncbi:MAG: hypothetical protein WBN75_07530 [Verrucomicrobiia bacterium]